MAETRAKTVLITGGTGFIGRALCDELLAADWAVTVLTRDAGAAREALPSDVAVIESLEEAAMPAAIVNLAGENLGSGRWNAERKRRFLDSRVGTTRQLIDFIAAAESAPEVLINGSAVGYYGARGDEPIDEDEPAGDEYQSDLCVEWEAEAQRAEAAGVRVCLLRLGVVLDAGGGAMSQMLTPFKLGLGGHYGSGRQWMPWIHRRDVVRAIRFLLERPDCRGPFNLTAPETVTNKGFARTLGKALRRPAIFWIPGPVVRLLVGEMARLFLTGQRVVPKRLQAAGFEFRYPALEDALTDIAARA